jgi:hypothetical protein
MSLQVTNTHARSSTAPRPGLGFAQSQADDEVQVKMTISETSGQMGGKIDDIEIQILNASGDVMKTNHVSNFTNTVNASGSLSIVTSSPRLNSLAETVKGFAHLTADDGTPVTVSDEAPAPFPKTCASRDTDLCLNNGRFQVSVDWKNAQGETGEGHRASQHDYRGEFWFFDPTNVDLIVDVLDGCSSNDRFWVFTAATTNVDFDLTVTDTMTGDSRVFSRPAKAEPISDTSAFATCP